ncbi:hypothetical protein [Aurantibacter sp.]|uniref:hypothetical protein n=1 Tax=Aurantibacter sp. TaxID=2807103 RepID=UPI0035C83492
MFSINHFNYAFKIKLIVILSIFLSFFNCNSVKNDDLVFSKPILKSECELDNYWSSRFSNYEKQNYELFKGEITISNVEDYTFKEDSIVSFYTSKINFEDDFLNIQSQNLKYNLVFTKGLIFPDIITKRNDKNIISISELSCLSKSYKVKRFSLMVSYINFANPELYVFELVNNSATVSSTWIDFVENAKLTYLQSCGFQI